MGAGEDSTMFSPGGARGKTQILPRVQGIGGEVVSWTRKWTFHLPVEYVPSGVGATGHHEDFFASGVAVWPKVLIVAAEPLMANLAA